MNIYESVSNFKINHPGTIAFRIREHARVVEKNIKPGEKLLYAFCGQNSMNNETNTGFGTCVIAFTDKRIIIGHKGLLFGHKLKSIDFRGFNDVTIEKGLVWSSLNIDTIKEEFKVACLTEEGANEAEAALSKALNGKARLSNNEVKQEKDYEVERAYKKENTKTKQTSIQTKVNEEKPDIESIRDDMKKRAKLDRLLRQKLDFTTNKEDREAIKKQIIDNYNKYQYDKQFLEIIDNFEQEGNSMIRRMKRGK